MKRLLSLALSAALLAGLTVPAAAETQDARLARVTQLVKETLDLNTEEYDTFNGGVSGELAARWDLNWSNQEGSLSIQALEDGTVVGLSRWKKNNGADYRGDSFPAFPSDSAGEARDAAQDFLSRVLRPGEKAELEEPVDGLYSGRASSSWEGRLRLNGLPSPLDWYICIEDGEVVNFSRETPEECAVGSVPSPSAAAKASEAAETLRETLKLRLEYVLKESGGTKAVPRYVPENIHSFCVDAGTGELLDLTELEAKMAGSYRAASGERDSNAPLMKEMAADEVGGLTRAEQEGVRQLEGVLSEEALDKAVRAESAYGLRGYALISSSYESRSVKDGEEAEVLCNLNYARKEGEQRLTREIAVDAKTGEVQSVWSSAPWDRERQVTEEEALEKAQAFLKARYPDRTTVLYKSDNDPTPWRTGNRPDWRFTFAQEAHGLPFGGNAISIGIDIVDGSVCRLSSSWDGSVTFEDPKGVISPETALSAWMGSYEAVLAYREVPQKLNKADPVQAKLMEQDLEYYYGLRLTYALEREISYAGVDAGTGALIPEEQRSARTPLAYTDLAGSSAKADIEKLAGYGAGYAADKFRPSKSVTQWDLVALLYSLQGTALEPDAAGEEERDSAYYTVCRMGALKFSQRDDEAVLTRADVVKMLLDAAGYGPAARLSGDIFTCDYTDRGTIPADGLGYAAIAQAMGLASGAYAGGRSATRGEAASMLCRVMERKAS